MVKSTTLLALKNKFVLDAKDTASQTEMNQSEQTHAVDGQSNVVSQHSSLPVKLHKLADNQAQDNLNPNSKVAKASEASATALQNTTQDMSLRNTSDRNLGPSMLTQNLHVDGSTSTINEFSPGISVKAVSSQTTKNTSSLDKQDHTEAAITTAILNKSYNAMAISTGDRVFEASARLFKKQGANFTNNQTNASESKIESLRPSQLAPASSLTAKESTLETAAQAAASNLHSLSSDSRENITIRIYSMAEGNRTVEPLVELASPETHDQKMENHTQQVVPVNLEDNTSAALAKQTENTTFWPLVKNTNNTKTRGVDEPPRHDTNSTSAEQKDMLNMSDKFFGQNTIQAPLNLSSHASADSKTNDAAGASA